MNRYCFLTLVIFTTTLPSWAQYDTYRWDRIPIEACNAEPLSDVAVDVFDRIYYVNESDDLIYQYDRNLGTCAILNAGATKVRYLSNIKIHNNKKVFYIGQNNKICSLNWDASQNKWIPKTYNTEDVEPYSQFDLRNANQIFYVRKGTRQVYNFIGSGPAQGNYPLNPNGSLAKSWTNLVYNDGQVFYVGDNGKLSFYKPNTTPGAWLYGNLNSDVVAQFSKIEVDDPERIFYVRAVDDRVSNYFVSGGVAQKAPLAGDLGQALQTTDLDFHNGKLYFISPDLRPHVFVWDDCRWLDQELHNNPGMSINYRCIEPSVTGKGLYYIRGTKKLEGIEQTDPENGFVYRDKMELKLDGTKYNENGICAFIGIYHDEVNDTWHIGPKLHSLASTDPANPSPSTDRICLDQPLCRIILKQHIEDMKAKGFNIIRFADTQVGADVDGIKASQKPGGAPYTDPKLYVKYARLWGHNDGNPRPEWTNDYKEVDTEFEQILFDLYDELLDIVSEVEGMKVNFYVGLEEIEQTTSHHQNYIDYVERFAARFKDREEIAYYTIAFEAEHNTKIFDKQYICNLLRDVYMNIRGVDKKHLITAGVLSDWSALTWDPGVFEVDFITFHIYPGGTGFSDPHFVNSFDRVINWYRNIMNDKVHKPWILGETGHLAWSNNPPQMQEQLDYAQYVMDHVYSCGAQSVFWWNYADVTDPATSNDPLFGLYTYDDQPKDIINPSVFLNNPSSTIGCGQGECIVPNDYYNVLEDKEYSVIGNVVDEFGLPIKDAFVLGVSLENPRTYTDEYGNYILRSNHPISAVKVSSIGKEYQQKGIGAFNVANFTLYSAGCHRSSTACDDCFGGEGSGKRAEATAISQNSNEISLWPNPSTGLLQISGSEIQKIRVFSLAGELLEEMSCDTNQELHYLNLSELEAGVYLVDVTTENGATRNKVVIVD